MSPFRSLILDVDSTLSGVEGIDWLASLRGHQIETSIARLTAEAMEGMIPLEAVYGKRLELVKPTATEVRDLSEVYLARMATDARTSIGRILARGVAVLLVTGGIREAILPVAREIGLAESDVHAVPIYFDRAGSYHGFDERSVLTRQYGKRLAVEQISPRSPVIAVGDGVTDLEIRPAVDAFAAYTGFVRRESVVEKADFVVEDFRQLTELVMK